MYYIISILLGLLPEVLYFTMFLVYTKNLKEKKIKLFLLISIAYFLCLLIQKYKTLYYILFVVLVYLILKLLYKEKSQIIDIFAFSISTIYLTLLACICAIILKNDYSNYFLYYSLYFISRVLLFGIFIFKNKFNIIYKKYCNLWNRNDNIKRPIKSITLRNVSLIMINVSIFILNIAIINI